MRKENAERPIEVPDDAEAPVVEDVELAGTQASEAIDLEAAANLPQASIDDIKQIGAKRIANAVPFPLPTLGMKVMVAPCDSRTYNAMMSAMFSAGDEIDPGAMSERTTIIVLKACVVEPKLDDEAVQALLDGAGADIMPLLAFCRKISRINDAGELLTLGAEAAEAFTRRAH